MDVRDQEFWLRWELRRLKRLDEMLKRVTQGEKTYAESLMMHLLLFQVKNG